MCNIPDCVCGQHIEGPDPHICLTCKHGKGYHFPIAPPDRPTSSGNIQSIVQRTLASQRAASQSAMDISSAARSETNSGFRDTPAHTAASSASGSNRGGSSKFMPKATRRGKKAHAEDSFSRIGRVILHPQVYGKWKADIHRTFGSIDSDDDEDAPAFSMPDVSPVDVQAFEDRGLCRVSNFAMDGRDDLVAFKETWNGTKIASWLWDLFPLAFTWLQTFRPLDDEQHWVLLVKTNRTLSEFKKEGDLTGESVARCVGLKGGKTWKDTTLHVALKVEIPRPVWKKGNWADDYTSDDEEERTKGKGKGKARASNVEDDYAGDSGLDNDLFEAVDEAEFQASASVAASNVGSQFAIARTPSGTLRTAQFAPGILPESASHGAQFVIDVDEYDSTDELMDIDELVSRPRGSRTTSRVPSPFPLPPPSHQENPLFLPSSPGLSFQAATSAQSQLSSSSIGQGLPSSLLQPPASSSRKRSFDEVEPSNALSLPRLKGRSAWANN